MFKSIYLLFILIIANLYLYLTPIFYLFSKSKQNMQERWFKNYFKIILYYLPKINIKIDNLDCIKKNKNIYILNHTSIIDNLVLATIINNLDLTFIETRSISKISSKKLQNKALLLHDMLLVNKNLSHDSKKCDKLVPKWIESNRTLQIILFPEGTIFQKKQKNNKNQIDLFRKNNIKPYKNLLFPKIGIFNILIDKLKNDIKNIYDITIIYKVKNKRVLSEFEIFKAISDPSFEILVKIKEYSLSDFISDHTLLYKVWSLKDKWIESNI